MGFLRLLLAIFVAQHHVGIYPYTGTLAVYGFYTLSGFLITLILNETYYDGWHGKGMFLLNRFLRIFPVYWACLLLSVACLYYAPYEARAIIASMRLPETDWWRQILIFGTIRINGTPYPTIVMAQSWTLCVELVYYLLIGLIVGKSRKLCVLMFACALLYWQWQLQHHASFLHIYLNVFSAALPFSVGSLLYHFRSHVPRLRMDLVSLLLLTFLLVMCPAALPPFAHYRRSYQLLSIVGFAFIIPSAYDITRRLAGPRLRMLERWCGDMSYPFFLINCPVAAAIVHLHFLFNTLPDTRFQLYMATHNLPLFYKTTLASLVISAGIVLLVQRPVERLRKKIRERAVASPA